MEGSGMEGKQLGLDAGRQAGLEAIARAKQAADPTWYQAAVSAVLMCAELGEPFTADDVWARIPDEYRTREPRALGAVMRLLSEQGVIESTGGWRESSRPQAHARPMRVWRCRMP
jgi:hypothetical protein